MNDDNNNVVTIKPGAEPTYGVNDRDYLQGVPRIYWPVPGQEEGFGEALRRIADEYGACPSCYRYSTFRKVRDESGRLVGGICEQCRYEAIPPPSAAPMDGGAR